MVAARILEPKTKLATTLCWADTTLPEMMDVSVADEDALYDAMDWLLEHQSRIENKLVDRHLHNDVLALHDLTSSYFESRTRPLAGLEHNRDGKKGKLQVNQGGLIMARETITIPPGKLWEQKHEGVEHAMGYWTYGCQATIKVGTKLVFVGGAVPIDVDGNIVGKGDLKAQYAQCIKNIEVVLTASGATLKDVVQMKNFTTDEAEFMRFGEWRQKTWPDLFGDPGAHNGAVGVAIGIVRVCHPDQMIEIDAIAVVDPE